MPKAQLRGHRRSPGPHAKTKRKTVNVSSLLMAALEERAAEEGLPVSRVIAQAIRRYLDAALADDLPTVDLAGVEDSGRRGSRGPAVQWPVQVSYVLDEALSEGVVALAERRDTGPNDIVREAIGLALAHQVVPARSPTRLRHDFITYDDASTARKARRPVIQVLDELRSQ